MEKILKCTHDEVWNVVYEGAQSALDNDELPIAAVLVRNHQLLAMATTTDRAEKSRIAHAELNLLQGAEKAGINLLGAQIYTSLEPCLMCLGAAHNCGISLIHYAMEAPLDGASLIDGIHSISEFGSVHVSRGQYPTLFGPQRQTPFRELFVNFLNKNIEPNGYTKWVQEMLRRV